MRDSQKQLEQLTQQMSRLMQEKAELETRNRILEQVVKLNVDHVEQLQTNKVCHNLEVPQRKTGIELHESTCPSLVTTVQHLCAGGATSSQQYYANKRGKLK